MPKRHNHFKSSSYRRKICEKIKTNNRKPRLIPFIRTCVFFTVISLLLSSCASVGADYVMPTPPQEIVITETHISVSLTTPTNTVFINVTEYDTEQIVKNITVEFREPVTYIGFTIEVLSDNPNYEDLPRNETSFQRYNETILQYYTLRFLTQAADKITNVTMSFAIDKDAAPKKGEGVTLVLYRYDGRKMEECPAEKFEEDNAFSYFNTTTTGSAFIAITRVVPPEPWWSVGVIIAIIMLLAVLCIYVCWRFKLANRRKKIKN
jgi:PGF-pre-PGF domain-containing protein